MFGKRKRKKQAASQRPDHYAVSPEPPVGDADQSLVSLDTLGQTLIGTIVDGELTADKVANLAFELRRCIESRPDMRNLVLDLQNVDYMDSSCLNMFVDLLSTVKASGGRIAIASAVDHVEVLFKLTRLDTLFPIKHDVFDAIQAVERTT